jgi:hypothetical protein
MALLPGEVSGWHDHPGPVFNVVSRDTVTIEDCYGGEGRNKYGVWVPRRLS